MQELEIAQEIAALDVIMQTKWMRFIDDYLERRGICFVAAPNKLALFYAILREIALFYDFSMTHLKWRGACAFWWFSRRQFGSRRFWQFS